LRARPKEKGGSSELAWEQVEQSSPLTKMALGQNETGEHYLNYLILA